MSPRLCQGDPKWATVLLGRSKSTRIKKAGCLVTAVAEAARELGLDAKATPVSVQARALDAWDRIERSPSMPFVAGGGAAFIAALGRANGLRIDERVSSGQGVVAMREAVVHALTHGGLALMHVDDDDDNVDDPQHWVLGVRIDGVDVIYADPANGTEGRLSLLTLAGTSTRLDRRPYRALGVRGVAPLPSSET